MDAEAHGEGETLARHERLLLEVAKRGGYNVTQIYREDVSGETIAARPVMQKLLQEVEEGVWSGVLVVEVERLARGDTIDQGIMAQTFKYSGTKIITPMKVYDPENEFDEEYFEFGLFMSRREYKTINRRLQRGRLASVKEGKYIAAYAPYGYEKVRNAKNCFPTVEIAGGICYFLWAKKYNGACNVVNKLDDGGEDQLLRPLGEFGDLFIRSNKAISIIKKVCNKAEGFWDKRVSSLDIELLKAIRDQVLNSTVIVISTKDESQANKIFEILNAKGKKLEHVDLIKNKIFELLDETEPADYAEDKWNTPDSAKFVECKTLKRSVIT